MNTYSILVVDDDQDILTSARLLLKQHYKNVSTLEQPSLLSKVLAKQKPDLILLDMNFRKGVNDGKEGIYWLKFIKEVRPQAEVVLMTAYGEVETAVKAIKEGAFDFVLKPWTNEKLLATIQGALKYSKERKKVEQLTTAKKILEDKIHPSSDQFVAHSAAMKDLLNTLNKVAKTDANVLLLGENGTGKSMLALHMHRLSSRHDNPFVTVDLGSITDSLFESELFGHKKGAFTDAKEDKAGRFETANEGTLFLDEIGNLESQLQAKLLNVLQLRRVTRLGENQERPFDVRLISATNSPIHAMVNENAFRQDLLYRINTVELVVPPLRERREDLPLLASRFLESFKKKYGKPDLSLSEDALDLMAEYNWPGNIRELQHCLERAVIMGDVGLISAKDLQLEATSSSPVGLNLDEMERHLVQKALAQFDGNISRSAKELGLTRAALYRRMEKHGL